MSFQYMPLYTGDYQRDTLHLSCSENGIYLKLLMHCWDQKGPAPLDDRKLCGIVNARSSDEIEALRRVLAEFFLERPDGYYNVRIQKEIERSEAISGARSQAGKAGYQAKAKQLLSKSQASATTISPSPSLNHTPEIQPPSAVVGKPAASRHAACPTDELLSLYHKRLPMLPRVEVVNDARRRSLSARWREVVTDPEIMKSGDARSAALDWFDWYFSHVAKSAFLTGRKGDWRADFDFLMTPSKFAKVVEGSYHKEHA